MIQAVPDSLQGDWSIKESTNLARITRQIDWPSNKRRYYNQLDQHGPSISRLYQGDSTMQTNFKGGIDDHKSMVGFIHQRY